MDAPQVKQKLLINAANVHIGGGATLLRALLSADFNETELVYFLDARFEIPERVAPNIRIVKVPPTIHARLMAEIQLAKLASVGDVVLCLGNMPPLFALPCFVFSFVQNRYLVDSYPLAGFSLKSRIRITIERWWLRLFARHADEFVVQTHSMQRLISGRIPQAAVSLMPFIGHVKSLPAPVSAGPGKPASDYRFLYVASAEPHKNHRTLLEAWKLLADEGLFPNLRLTLDDHEGNALSGWIKKAALESKLSIQFGSVNHREINELYENSDALLFPSLMESLGLPLIEARQAGIDVIAGECDYVRDILDPCQTFDPTSALSLARAVKRYMGISKSEPPLLDARDFLHRVWKKAR